jgi:hypothetical protein
LTLKNNNSELFNGAVAKLSFATDFFHRKGM